MSVGVVGDVVDWAVGEGVVAGSMVGRSMGGEWVAIGGPALARRATESDLGRLAALPDLVRVGGAGSD